MGQKWLIQVVFAEFRRTYMKTTGFELIFRGRTSRAPSIEPLPSGGRDTSRLDGAGGFEESPIHPFKVEKRTHQPRTTEKNRS